MVKKKTVTFDDIAKYTGFSKTTISRYFNNPDSIRPKNKDIIADALEKLNYQENKVAKVLANGKTEFIGVVVPDLYHHFYSEVLSELLSTYREFGYKFLIFNGDKNEDTELQYIQELMSYKIEGLIILSHTIPSSELAKLNVPIVAIEREDNFISSVNTDNFKGGQKAAQLLIDKGCDVLIHINSHADESHPSYRRILGFLDICENTAIDHEVFKLGYSRSSLDELTQGITKVLSDIETSYAGKRKGFFVSSDTYANILLNIIVRKYGRLPEDFMIVGFDNSSISKDSVIPITTIGQKTKEMAHDAISILTTLMNTSSKRRNSIEQEPVHHIIEPLVIERETTGS